MMFQYRARDRMGRKRVGRIEAQDRAGALARFRQEQLTVEELLPVADEPAPPREAPAPVQQSPRAAKRLPLPKKSWQSVLGALCLLVGAVFWLAPSGPQAAPGPPSGEPQPMNVTVKWRGKLPIGKLRIVFPELPMAQEIDTSELLNSWQLGARLANAAAPTYAHIYASDGWQAQPVHHGELWISTRWERL